MRPADKRRVCRTLADRIRTMASCQGCFRFGHEVRLEFHHLDPSTKYRATQRKKGGVSDIISTMGSVQKTVEEIELCATLCRECHVKVEQGRLKPRLAALRINRRWAEENVREIRGELELRRKGEQAGPGDGAAGHGGALAV